MGSWRKQRQIWKRRMQKIIKRRKVCMYHRHRKLQYWCSSISIQIFEIKMVKWNRRNRLRDRWFLLLGYPTMRLSSKKITTCQHLDKWSIIWIEALAISSPGWGKMLVCYPRKLAEGKQWKFNINRWYFIKTPLSSLWFRRWNYFAWSK